MRVVLFLEALLSCRLEVLTSNHYHVVTAVCRRVVDGLVLAHEDKGDRRGQAAQGAFIGTGIDIVPCARVGETGLLTLIRIEVAPDDSAMELFTLPTSCDILLI